jgi:demethylmenaquinone methyltransferase/2-methoxy-6-polyprenyl-1,4-benzoquinol methylase
MRETGTAKREGLAPHPPLGRYYDGALKRRGFVDSIFDTTAEHYDWINNVMSIGHGVWYRKEALKRAGLGPDAMLLDVCIGTGLVTRAALDLVGDPSGVIGVDASMGMLIEAKRAVGVPLIKAYVEALPVADGAVGFVSMGYALRHVADLIGTFAEYLRVLRPGGTLLILEVTRPENRALYLATRLYLRTVVPLLARICSRDAKTLMQYFWDTIESCVAPSAILSALAEAGFEDAARRVEYGVFSEYTARKPGP